MNYAHTPAVPNGEFEPWLDHAGKVYQHLKDDCELPEPIAYILGYAHDLGKLRPRWQEWLRMKHEGKDADGKWVEHKDYGAYYLREMNKRNNILSKVIAAHHGRNQSGVMEAAKNSIDFRRSLLSSVAEFGAEISPTEEEQKAIDKIAIKLGELPEHLTRKSVDGDFENDNYFRYYLSCLIYADWRSAAEWAGKELEQLPSNESENNVERNLEKLTAFYEKLNSVPAPEKVRVNAIRDEIRRACESAASVSPNEVYKMSLPTGAGKTLCSMDWALRHAKEYNKTRVVVVIPYTRIIKQNAEVYRKVFGDEAILEAHSLVNYTEANKNKSIDGSSWHRDIVITTDVAFFGSFYTANVRNLMRLHALKDSVIIFDECQWIPRQHLLPCTAMMNFLCKFLNSTILLSTATMPNYDYASNYYGRISYVDTKNLIPKELELKFYKELKRVETMWLGQKDIDSLVTHYGNDRQSALFIVNSTKYAQELFDALASKYGEENLFHLSKCMTQSDIEGTLNEVTKRLGEGKFTVMVSTILIEAGVDISFPVVYRCQTGLDSLAQSAGRCNRNGEMAVLGKTYLYEATEDSADINSDFWRDVKDAWDAMEEVFGLKTLEEGSVIDIYDDDKMEQYFNTFYRNLRGGNFDKNGLTNPDVIRIGKNVELIEGATMVTVFVPRTKGDLRWAKNLIEKDKQCEKGYRLTRSDEEKVKESSVEVYYSRRKSKLLDSSCLGEPDDNGCRMLRGVEMYILDTETKLAPIVYDPKKGLITVDIEEMMTII